VAAKRRPAPRVRAAALPLPRLRPARLLPSLRSLLVGLGLLAIAGGAYAVALETPLFSVDRVAVAGAPPDVARQVRTALAPVGGHSLLGLDGADVERRVLALPSVVAVRYDRAFPHELRIRVVPERPVAVLRRGAESWLVSARGRVIRALPRAGLPPLPRIWLDPATAVEPGQTLADDAGGAAARALAPLLTAPLPVRVRAAAYDGVVLRLRLANGVDVRFGSPASLRLKLAVLRRILRVLPAGTTYVDLSVPERPVSG
jgi:cell division protein FtsQ